MLTPVKNIACDFCDKKQHGIMIPLRESIRDITIYICEECLVNGLIIIEGYKKPKGKFL